MESEMSQEDPPTLPCPYSCGSNAESQGGTSYYICPTCEVEFDRDELDEHGQLKED